MSNRYEYLVSYAFQGGSGRGFATTEGPINTQQGVIELEKGLAENQGGTYLPKLFVNNIVLLREWSE